MNLHTHIFRDPPLDPDAPCDHWRACTADEAEVLRGQGFEVKRLFAPMRAYGWVRMSRRVKAKHKGAKAAT